MAQLLSPVCTEALKFQSPLNCFSSRSPSPCPRPILRGWTTITHSSRRRYPIAAAAAAAAGQASPDVLAEDYYEVLGLLPDATPAQIKKAYYNCMKACHPDLSGNDPETTNFCMFINEVYAVLSDPIQRMVYDEIHGHALTATNPFFSDSSPRDHAFVDEFSCIGCKNCANVAPDVFGIEEDYGRARVHSQCGKPELVQQAIDSCLRCVWLNAASEYEERLDQLQLISSLVHDNITFIGRLISLGAENKTEVCPVDCIHWTSAAQLSLLEDEMRRIERINVALMLSGMGSGGVDVFRMASSRWEKRQSKALEQAKIRMMKKKGSDKTESYWSNLWGSPKDIQNKEEEVKERAKRAAAAARRWREYSRRGADKPPTYKLPEAISNQEK